MPGSSKNRLWPQSYSRDRRYGRLSLKATTLYPLLWANADDQGRLSGEPDEVKYTACPNISQITVDDVSSVLAELTSQNLIVRYPTPRGLVIQLLDWWDTNNKLQWAWPSEYPTLNGWADHLRYKKGRETVVTENWPAPQISMPLPVEPDTARDAPRAYSDKDKDNIRIQGQIHTRESSPESSGEETDSKPGEEARETDRDRARLAREVGPFSRANGPVLPAREVDSRANGVDSRANGVDSRANGVDSRARDPFETFWKAYPKKLAKAAAQIAFLKINPDDNLLASMIDALDRAKTSDQWTRESGRFIPYPATWLNQRRWQDEEMSGDSNVESRTDQGQLREGMGAYPTEEQLRAQFGVGKPLNDLPHLPGRGIRPPPQ